MAWTYGGWRRETTAAARRDMLILHVEEIENKITADVAAHGYSRTNHPLIELLKLLQTRLDGLDGAAGTVNGGSSLATFEDEP